jgi:mannose-6-phosphate isomerase-like protein (cupin superfamily)
MIYNTKSTSEIDELTTAWQAYIATMDDWQKVVEDTTPKQTYCGPIYEPASPLNRPNESFAISDMREVKVAKPHYHIGGETEIYFVLSGSGLTVVGGEEIQIKAGDVIVTPPETAHFTIPKENLVMIVINTPPFNPDNNIKY